MAAGTSVYEGMGANLQEGEVCSFRVWAPNAKAVTLVGDFTQWTKRGVKMAPEGNGCWSVDVEEVSAGQAYKFIIDNIGGSAHNPGGRFWRVDPYAREVQNSLANANSYVVDPDFAFTPFQTPRFENFLLYQLHVGAFAGYNDTTPVNPDTREALFVDIIPKLNYIRALGFNALALLPVGQMGLRIGEGYSPTNWFAPDEYYGSPTALRQLVEAAHQTGLAVIFDVVYNHASTQDNRCWEFDGMNYDGGIYFEGGGDTPFGKRPALWKREIQDFFLDNARMWLKEYGADGLRFDATHLIPEDSLRHIVLNGIRKEFPDKYLIAEYFRTFPDPYDELGFHAIWDGLSPHAFEAAVNSADGGALIESLLNERIRHGWNLVRYPLGSHDEIADLNNGALTERRYFIEKVGGRDNWYARAKARLGWALAVALPGTPMLFMGTECHAWGYWSPNPDSNGDHRFDWKLSGDRIGLEMRRLVTDANNVRWGHPALRSDSAQWTFADSSHQIVAFTRWDGQGDTILTVVNLSDGQWEHGEYGVRTGETTGTWEEIFNSQSPQYGGWNGSGNYEARKTVQDDTKIYINLPKWSVLMFRKV
jgi:1,4-alpha-glucan branching enzyme